jgi:hypothetical protein
MASARGLQKLVHLEKKKPLELKISEFSVTPFFFYKIAEKKRDQICSMVKFVEQN